MHVAWRNVSKWPPVFSQMPKKYMYLELISYQETQCLRGFGEFICARASGASRDTTPSDMSNISRARGIDGACKPKAWIQSRYALCKIMRPFYWAPTQAHSIWDGLCWGKGTLWFDRFGQCHTQRMFVEGVLFLWGHQGCTSGTTDTLPWTTMIE